VTEPSAPPGGLRLRRATAADAERIAALHAESWRSAYRGILRDAYLDGPIQAERRAVWAERLALPADRAPLVTIAEDGDAALGFVCVYPEADPRYGSLIENLHVGAGAKRRGVAKRLLESTLGRLGAAARRRPVHLLVFAANAAARKVYDRLGGRAMDRVVETEPDGSRVEAIRYVWPTADALLDRLGRGRRGA